jgi:phage FluMu protein Com
MTILLFAMFAVQISLCVHLLLEGHQHNSQKCPICQELFSLTHNITVEESTIISRELPFRQCPTFYVEIIPATSTFNIFSSRAPPSVS